MIVGHKKLVSFKIQMEIVFHDGTPYISCCCQRAAKATAAAVVDVDDGDHLLHKARSGA